MRFWSSQTLADDGADLIDVGCEPEVPGPAWRMSFVRCAMPGIEFRSIVSIRVRLSAAVRAGAELVLSVNSSNREAARDWGCEVVVVPDDPRSLAGLDETIECLAQILAFRCESTLCWNRLASALPRVSGDTCRYASVIRMQK